MDRGQLDSLLTLWLQEDVQTGDVTSSSLFENDLKADAEILFKQDGLVCGLDLVHRLYERVDPTLEWDAMIAESASVAAGDVVARFRGAAASVMVPERLALNLLGHLSGVATLAQAYRKAVEGFDVDLVDTRKTLPGLRSLEKYATRVGGWVNHRMGLHDLVLIKDNHLAALKASGIQDPMERALHLTRDLGMCRQIEVQTEEEAAYAARLGAEMILLDNMSLDQLARSVERARKENPKVLLEASGRVSLETVRAVASSGVDRISVGSVTHSAPSLDVSLEVIFRG